MSETVDAVIIGAGAAGLMCAIAAGRRGKRVLVLEHNEEAGRKILISGGGRCNFTNLGTKATNFLSENPHFAKSALARFGPRDFVAMVEQHGIRYHEKAAGQLFCDGSAKEIVEMLLKECAAAGVEVRTGCVVSSVAGAFDVETSAGAVSAAALVVACGGLSIPKMGATGFGHDIARQYGLRVTECRPALVPWTFAKAERERLVGLAGVAADAEVSAGGAKFREKLLFTHRGLSGPAVLQASSYWKEGETVTIDLAPGIDLAARLKDARSAGSKAEARTIAGRVLPRRLAEVWLAGHTKPLAVTGDKEIAPIDEAVHRWKLLPAGTEGYEKAEVTAGGVDTAELSSKTMEASKQPGLYFVGEVVDVTGQLGGYNFQWAWASGWAAGIAL